MRTKQQVRDLAFFEESLKEGLKYARGQKANVKVETLRVRIGAEDIKEARHVLKISQPQFARLMSVSSETVKKWEQGRNPIPAAVGYWAIGLKTQPETTKKLLFQMIGHLTTPRRLAVR